MTCRLSRTEATISVTGLAGWQPRRIGLRFENTFGQRLTVRPA